MPALHTASLPLLNLAPMGSAQIVALVLALLALLLSGFMSGSEIAYFSITPQQKEELDETPRGRKILSLLAKPERLLATILIANNLVNVTIVILCNFALGPVFEGMSAVVSFILQSVILTFLILLFGEILPKLIANSNNMRWAQMAIGGINVISTLCRPVSALLVSSSGLVNRVVQKKETDLTPDDLSKALEITRVDAGDDKEMLEGILKFGDTTAHEIMTPRVDITGVETDMTFEEVMAIVLDSGYSRLPAFGDSQDDIRGILYARDLLPYIGKAPTDFDWRKLLREAYYVPESRMIDDLLEDFRRRRIHMAIVVDEFGGTQGLVTLEDVLEEIVGDINDEYDEDEVTFKRLRDDTYIFEGKTLLGDFFRITGLDEEEYDDVTEDCETLAGMLLAIKGDFPKEKESIVYGHCRFLVMDISGHRIASVRVKVMPEAQEDAMVPETLRQR
ncbi:MAG: hemolysin family protein [Alloprevotella sp.]|nr:hemolysin family protein [Alloprevotella sp.]